MVVFKRFGTNICDTHCTFLRTPAVTGLLFAERFARWQIFQVRVAMFRLSEEWRTVHFVQQAETLVRDALIVDRKLFADGSSQLIAILIGCRCLENSRFLAELANPLFREFHDIGHVEGVSAYRYRTSTPFADAAVFLVSRASHWNPTVLGLRGKSRYWRDDGGHQWSPTQLGREMTAVLKIDDKTRSIPRF